MTITDDELSAKFLPQFVTAARSRLAIALAAVQQRDHGATTTTVRELHSLVGEAGLLGLDHIVPLARDGERMAKRLHVSRTDADADALAAALRELDQVIERVAAMRSNREPDR